MTTKFITGFKKKQIDFILIFRIFFASIKHWGFLGAFRELRKYSKDKRNSFKNTTNRYVKQGQNYFAIPDLPPINSKYFIENFINEVEVINSSAKQKLNFAITCISSRCPYSCEYCYNSYTHSSKEKIPIEILIKTIKGLQKEGISNIYLSGGEPMMRWKEIPRILKECKNEKTGFWLITTGWKLDNEKFVLLKKIGLRGVMISFDSSDKKIVNKIKRGGDAFESAVNAVKLAKQNDLIVVIDCVVGKELSNENKFREHIEFLGKLGASFVNCYLPKGFNKKSDIFNKFSIDSYKKVVKLTRENQREKNFSHLPISLFGDEWEAKRGCVGGKNFIYIDPDGEVKPCPFVQASFGNIIKSDISDILENKSKFRICNTNLKLNKIK